MNKKWVCIAEDEDYRLIFTPFDDEITVAKVYRDDDREWVIVSELLSKSHDYLAEVDVSVDDMKEMVEEMIAEHYEDEANYYQLLLKLFKE